MIKRNNPAGRLISLLEKFEEQRRDPFNVNDNRTAWKNILNLETDDDMEIFQAILSVNELVRDTKATIKNTAPNPSLYLASFENIEKAVFPRQLDDSFEKSMKLIDARVLHSLEFSCELLSQHYDEGEVSQDDLSDIDSTVSELFSYAKNADIDPNVRTFIMESLEAIRRSISHYNIYGPKGLREAFQLTLGGVFANQEKLKETNAQEPELMNRIAKLLAKMDAVTATAFKAKKVISNAMKFLGFDE